MDDEEINSMIVKHEINFITYLQLEMKIMPNCILVRKDVIQSFNLFENLLLPNLNFYF